MDQPSIWANEPTASPTRFCVLTPEGRGAIAVVRVWGPRAIEVANAVFRPHRGSALSAPETGRPRFGRVGPGRGDEVVAIVTEGDYPEVEIQGHGGVAAIALIVDALVTAGAERRQPVNWIRHQSRSAVEAEALVDLARATTLRAAEILLEQAQGALEADVRQVIADAATAPAEAAARIDRLLERSELGLRLISGWRVVLAGRPNVGKSRLLNALAGYERAIVDPTPGTTRDVVTVRTAIAGWPVELADTAGLRAADDAVEALGVEQARARQRQADLVLLLLDRSEPLTDADRDLERSWDRRLIVANKSDLPAAWEPEPGSAVNVSAATGEGLDTLIQTIAQRLVPDPPTAGAGVPFRLSHVRTLDEARRALARNDMRMAIDCVGVLLSGLSRV